MPLLLTVEDDCLADWPASTTVNSPANNDERCIEMMGYEGNPDSLFGNINRH